MSTEKAAQELEWHGDDHIGVFQHLDTPPAPAPQPHSADEVAIVTGFMYGVQSDLLPKDEVRHRIEGFKATQGYKEALTLLEADRKKHEIEARYDELSHVFSIDEPHTHIHGKHPRVISVAERKAQLKKELENL